MLMLLVCLAQQIKIKSKSMSMKQASIHFASEPKQSG
jgi:hypothetical protein